MFMKSIWGNWSNSNAVFYVDKNRYYHKALVYLQGSTHRVAGPIFGHVFKTTKLYRVTELYSKRSSYTPLGVTKPAYVENEGFLLRLI